MLQYFNDYILMNVFTQNNLTVISYIYYYIIINLLKTMMYSVFIMSYLIPVYKQNSHALTLNFELVTITKAEETNMILVTTLPCEL